MRIRQYDTYPITYQCVDENNKPIDLSAAGTVTFTMTKDGDVLPSVAGSASIQSASVGLVQYFPTDEDKEVLVVGMYKGEWKINFSGDVLTLPRNDILWIYVMGATSG